MRVPKVKPRRRLEPGSSYMESDRDWIENNMRAVVWFLENRQFIADAIRPIDSVGKHRK